MATPKQQTTQASSTSKNINTARIDRLFARLSAAYGHIWQSQFKSEGYLEFAKKEWGKTLSVFEEKSMHAAMDHCKKHISMPPTLPAFYQLCRYYQGKKIETEFESMQRKLRDAEQACKHWKKIISVAQEKGQKQIALNLQKVLDEARQHHTTIKDTLAKTYHV